MAEPGTPAGGRVQSNPQDVGERMVSLETQLSQLTTLVTSLVDQQKEQVESSVPAVAPGGGGTEYAGGTHSTDDATGRTAGGTGGDAQGLGVSSMGVGSSSLAGSGLNPNVFAVNRSSAGAASFGSIGIGSGAVGSQSFVPGTVGRALGSQSSVPPEPTPSSRWWESVASGNNLIPGAGITDTGEKLGGGPFKVPKAPVFDGTDVSYPSWSQNFLLSARHNNLYEAFVSETEIPIADIGFDLTPWVEKGFSVGVLRQAEMAWWFLFDCLKKDSLKTMVRHAGSSSKGFRVLKDHFLPLSQSQIRVQEEKLKSLRMRSNENPSIFFASVRETLGVLQMLEVKKDDREVCNLMLEGLSHEYKTLRETLVVFCPNDPSFIETKVRERYLDLQTQGGPKKHSVALMSRPEKKSAKKQNYKSRSNSESDSSKKTAFQGKCFKCGEVGHVKKDCLARVIAHPSQTGSSKDAKNENGEISELLVLLSQTDSDMRDTWNDTMVFLSQNLSNDWSDDTYLASWYDSVLVNWVNSYGADIPTLYSEVADRIRNYVGSDRVIRDSIREYATLTKKRCFEDWYADTGTAFHMTDSLSCMKDVKPCHKNVKGIGGVTCEVALSGTLELVFVSADNEFLVELKNVLYCPKLGYNLFSPSAEFDGESWNGLGGPRGVMTAFHGHVTFENFDGMLVATAYRVGDDSIGSVLAALTPSNP